MINEREAMMKRHVIWFVVMVLGCVLVGGVYGAVVSGKAFGDDKRCTHTNPDGECWFGVAGSVKHFKSGYFRHSHGLPAHRMFAHPRAARQVFTGKLSHRINHLSYTHRSRIAWKFFGRSRTGGLTDCFGVTDCYGCDDACLAQRMYADFATHAGCVGYGRPTTSTNMCRWHDTTGPITKRGVQRGGALVICGTAVALGVLAAPESAGSSTVAAGAITGSVGCGWSFWASFN